VTEGSLITLTPSTIEEDEEKGTIIIEIDVGDLPEGTKAIQMPNGDIIPIGEEKSLRLEISRTDLQQSRKLEIIVLSESEIPLGKYEIPVLEENGDVIGVNAVNAQPDALPARVDGLVFLGYPLHPPKQPQRRRDAHLGRIDVPMLFVQGERDVFGNAEEMAPLVAALPHAALHVVEPSSLAVEASYWTSGTIWAISGGCCGPALTADGRVWLPGGTWMGAVYFDPVTGTFTEHRASATEWVHFMSASFAASADGSRLLAMSSNVVTSSGNYNDTKPWTYTPASDRFVHEDAAPQLYSAVLSADGARALWFHRVYDVESWTLRGEAKIPDTFVGGSDELSPDGRRVYRAVHAIGGEANGSVLRVDVFDADAAVAGTTDLVKLGEIPVAAQVSSCGVYSSDPWDCAGDTILRVSPLGDTLFLGGSRTLMVVPVPPALSGVGAP
jgi:hypothetical protein